MQSRVDRHRSPSARVPRGPVGAGLVAALLLGCSGGDPEPAPVAGAAAAPQYAGTATCGECHAAQLAAWQGSDHDRAMQEARDDTVLGDFDDAQLSSRGVTSHFGRRDGAFIVRTEGAKGGPEDLEVAWTFGFDPLQQYLVRRPGGRVQALGLAWDARPAARGGQRWMQLFPDAAPGDPLHWTGIDQTWNHMCAECHSTGLEKRYDAESDSFDTRWAALDVACEACHGPGAAHAAWARQRAAEGEADSATGTRERGDPGLPVAFDGRGEWVRGPGDRIAHLPTPRVARGEADACGRCHSRRARLLDAVEPGAPLLDTHRPALLEAGLYFPDGQIQDEVYVWGSFLQSRMYAAGVACSDCHDPHALHIDDPQAVCTRCHDPDAYASPAHHHHEAGSQGARCVSCHMPERVYMQVDARRDHGFRVPRPDLSVELGTPDACGACHADRDPAWSAQVVRRWFPRGRSGSAHFAAAFEAGRRGRPGADAALADVAEDPAQPAIVRATALHLLADAAGPRSAAAIRAGAADPDPLVRMAAAGAARSLPPASALAHTAALLRDPRRVVRIEAASVLSAIPPGFWRPPDRSALAEALAEYRDVQQANADRPESLLNLGVLHARFGELDLARRAYEHALRLDPGFTPAAVNLADLDREEGREADAERVLREALARQPDTAELYYALGLSLVRQGRRDEALAAFARSAELAPDAVGYAYAWALSLHDAGRTEEAIAALRDAHARREGDRDVLLALVTLLRDTGQRAAALGYARAFAAQAPDSAEARALAAELETGDGP